MDTINLLVTLDGNYIPPLNVMLKSLFVNNPGEVFHVYMIYDNVSPEELRRLKAYCAVHGSALIPVMFDAKIFDRAPVFRYYSKAMYYRLLAFKVLPENLTRVLYLDPDTLVINPVRGLYETDLAGYLFAGAIHVNLTGVTDQINKIRLGTYESEGYYNSGVLLLNLELQRQTVREEDIFHYVNENQRIMILPDQDVLNGLYGEQILPIDDSLYNYDARKYEAYRMLSVNVKDMDWVMENTVILHFCGKTKPWVKNAPGRFSTLFKHYAAKAAQTLRDLEETGNKRKKQSQERPAGS